MYHVLNNHRKAIQRYLKNTIRPLIFGFTVTTFNESRENPNGRSPRAVVPKIWSLTGSRSPTWEQVRMQIHRPHLKPTEQKLRGQGPVIPILTKA